MSGKKLLSFTHLSAQLSACSCSALPCCLLLLHTLMPSSVAVLHCVGYMRLLSRLLGQLRRMAPSRNGDRGSHGLPYSLWGCSVTVNSLSAGRRSLLCRGAPPGPVWVLPPHCPARSSSFDSFCSSSHRSTARKMSSSTSSSSSANNEQGKPKPKSPFRKRGSLQSTTSPGECGSRGGLTEMVSEPSYVGAEQHSAISTAGHLSPTCLWAVRWCSCVLLHCSVCYLDAAFVWCINIQYKVYLNSKCKV